MAARRADGRWVVDHASEIAKRGRSVADNTAGRSGTGDMSGDRGTGRRPNLVLVAKRQQRGWGRGRAARELHRLWKEHFQSPPELDSLVKSIRRHETGEVQVRDEIYRRLYCLAYDSSPQELFGATEVEWGGEYYSFTSHKFTPAYLGPESAARLVDTCNLIHCEGQWLDCHEGAFSVLPGANLYVWPFGVALFHLAERLTMPNLASMAVWRQQSYREHLEWATNQFRSLTRDRDAEASYIFSLYWVTEPAWSGAMLETALRIHSMPKVLLERDQGGGVERATLVERSLLAEGFTHPEISSYGVPGISVGYASWSAVVYHPVAPERALTEDETIACELATQALWMYCAYINGEIEKGKDPEVSPQYGWRFLRAMRSKLTNPRPQEVGQHRSMRNAILETSGILNQLDHAIEALRESAGG